MKLKKEKAGWRVVSLILALSMILSVALTGISSDAYAQSADTETEAEASETASEETAEEASEETAEETSEVTEEEEDSECTEEETEEIAGSSDGGAESSEEMTEEEAAAEEQTSQEEDAEEAVPADDAAVEESEEETELVLETASEGAISYQTYVTGSGWQSAVSDGTTSGTTGQSLALKGFSVSLPEGTSGGISITGHYATIGWKSGTSSGTSAQILYTSYDLQAITIELTGDIADEYDVYYRVHSAKFGWLDWARNGEEAGTTGWGYAAQAIQIVLVEKDGTAPGSTENSCVPATPAFTQVDQLTTVDVSVAESSALVSLGIATQVRITATMSYGGTTTRSITETASLSSLTDDTFTMDFTTYGPFTVKVEYLKSGSVVRTLTTTVGISADEYNLAPLSATYPVTLFSLSYDEISVNDDGELIPTIIMLSRPSAYNWDCLLEGMYAMPYLTESAIQSTCDYEAFAAYVKALYELNPNATFHLYINDMTCSMVHQMIYANGIPEGQYSIVLLSDGSGTYLRTNEAYAGDDPEATHEELVALWEEAKAYAYETGEVADGYGYHEHWDSMYVVLTVEEGTQWWMARTNLFTSGDDNVFADKIASDENVIKKSIADMLTALEERGDEAVAAFKALYDFNDSYFSDAEEQGKKVMMILGTYVNLEENFEDYANLTMAYYGDDYLYYYKGHPNTPTDLYPEKQTQLDELGIIDVDSSVAAELILFFNEDIAMSGYGSSTFNSATDDMAGGLFAMTKEEALSSTSIDYSVVDWFASLIDSDTDAAIVALCDEDDTCYLMEFADDILETADYDFAIYSVNGDRITYYTTDEDGTYSVVRVQAGSVGVNTTAHVQSYGWLETVSDGETAGTTDESKRLEAVTIALQNSAYEGSITYRVHVASDGWQDWVSDGETAGTTGESKAIQAIEIELTGEMAEYYDVYYRVHSQKYGWLDWACNGETAGTTGLSLRAEAIQVVLVEKGGEAPGDTDTPYVTAPTLSYSSHLQTYGWTSGTSSACTTVTIGTTGLAKRLEALTLSLDSEVSGSITYRTHVQTYGWQSWASDGLTSGTTGLSKRVEAIEIELTGELAEKFDVYYRVHVQSYGWLDWAKNGETAGTTGLAKRAEAIQIVLVPKGGSAPGSTTTAYISK